MAVKIEPKSIRFPIHPLGAPWPPRSTHDKLLIGISESRKSPLKLSAFPVNAGLTSGHG
jgi:hypothetical protein